MAVMWTVWPLDEDTRAWLASEGIDVPEEESRFPTGSEIKRVLSRMRARVKVSDNGHLAPWSALVETGPEANPEWTVLMIAEYSGDEEPQKFYFEKGHEGLIQAILKQLTPMSGPLVLMNDAGGPPEVIAA